MELITSAAMRCGFTGGLVVDYPNSTRAKKYCFVRRHVIAVGIVIEWLCHLSWLELMIA
jgi:hypothetical protein